ncbi:MAG: carbohydrate ABC transporter permease [Clostridia bacterium]|nr:carbohydrate ABC transporter permease [Oscillospiraceae bacterium]MBO5359037.1 carbohydrate ABC transporter permease [Clostridia bacterium]
MATFKRKRPLSAARLRSKGAWAAVYILMTLVVCFTMLPLVYLVSTAFKPLSELFVFPPQFFVRNPTLKNFSDLLLSMSSSAVPFSRYVFNSALVTAATVVGTIFVSTLGAYGMVKHNPPGSKLWFQIILAALMISPYVTQIPRYLIINSVGLINSYWALIIPSIATAYNFFLVKQFVEQIPNTLIEAARIDGCGEMRIYGQIIMPLLTPAWSTLMVFSFVNSWNDYFSPLIYLNDQALKTLPLALNTISGGSATIGRAGAVAAATLLMTLPTVILFMISQKRVMQTMVHSGIKG